MDRLGGRFQLLAIGTDVPEMLEFNGITVKRVALCDRDCRSPVIANRYLGKEKTAVYLLRPDQHVCGRWRRPERAQVRAALRRALALN